MNEFEIIFLKARFSLSLRIKLYKKLMQYTKQGFPVFETLIKLKKRQESSKNFQAKIFEIWINEMKKGKPFYQAIVGWVPETEINLIAAGEKGEGLNVGLDEAIRFTESFSKIKSIIIGGSIYPVALIVIAFFFIASFSTKLAPVFLSFLPLNFWPSDAQFLLALSNIVSTYWYLVLGAMGLGGFFISKTIGLWNGIIREKVLDKLPPWSIYKSYNTAAFLITLSSMMRSGTPLNNSLQAMSKISNTWLKTYLDKMMKNLKSGGKNFGVALDVGLMDKETAGDIIDYSELGSFEKAIHEIGTQNIEDIILRIGAQMAVFRNVMLLFVGVIISWIYFTTYMLNTIVAENATSRKPMVTQPIKK